MIKFLLLTFTFIFCGLWALIFTMFVEKKPKTYWVLMILALMLIYYLY